MKLLKKTLFLGAMFLAVGKVHAGDWSDVDQYLPIRQKAFCNLMDKYEKKANLALESANQIKQNKVYTDRGNDLLALMQEEGKFRNWLVQVDAINVVSNGDAIFDMRLQCGIHLGSGTNENGQGYAASAKKDGLVYGQLAQVVKGDFVLISGNFIRFNELSETSDSPIFATYFEGNSMQKIKRFNESIRYFTDISSLSKFQN